MVAAAEPPPAPAASPPSPPPMERASSPPPGQDAAVGEGVAADDATDPEFSSSIQQLNFVLRTLARMSIQDLHIVADAVRMQEMRLLAEADDAAAKR